MAPAVLRPAKPQDIPAVVALAVESVTTVSPIPELALDREEITETAKLCLQPAHFLWVSEIDGDVVAAVGAMVSKSFWHKRLQLSVLLHYSRAPGQWVALMRALAAWMKGRPAIKMAIIELEDVHSGDERMLRFLRRLGFARESKNLCYVRGSQ